MTADRREDRSSPSLLIGAALAVFILLTILVTTHDQALQRVDDAVSAGARTFALAHPVWLAAMRAISVTGRTVLLDPAIAILCALLLWRRRPQAACFAAVAMVLTLTTRLVLMTLIARPRPAGGLVAAAGWSFPSGHTTASATVALILALIYRRAWVSAAAGAWAVAVGVSRVALAVHWPSDVLGGWVLALTMVPATHLAVGAVFDRRSS